MLDVCLLGTGGMMPLPYRWLTSLMVRYNGSSLLVDCGEGTQIAIKETGRCSNGWSISRFYYSDFVIICTISCDGSPKADTVSLWCTGVFFGKCLERPRSFFEDQGEVL